MNNKELVNAGHELAKAISNDTPLIEIAKMVSNLATQLDVQTARANVLVDDNAKAMLALKQADEAVKLGHSKFVGLVAENAGLKAALRPSDIPSEWTDAFGDTAVIEHDSTGDNQGHSVSWSWVGNQEEVIKSVLLAVDKGIETPATDAFLAEVRAQGVEMLREHPAIKLCSLTHVCDEFAAQLRKGVQS